MATGPRRAVGSWRRSVGSSKRSCRFESTAELDSHADTSCVGKVGRVLEYTERICNVSPFAESYEPMKDVPIANVAVGYYHPDGGELFILVINQCLYFGDRMDHVLLCPNQMRSHGIVVDDCPRHLSLNRSSTHSLFVPSCDVRIPLHLRGVMSCFDCFYPSDDDLETGTHIELTSATIEWDPYSLSFAETEARSNVGAQPSGRTEFSRVLSQVSRGLPVETFATELEATVGTTLVSAAKSADHRSATTPESLASKWAIGIEAARDTLKVTTQRGIRNAVHPIHRRYRTSMKHMRYPSLNCVVYTDTLFASTKSIRGNKCGQIFATDFDYTRFVPMERKGEASTAMKLFIQDVGIPRQLHSDGALELTKGEFRRVCDDFGIMMTRTEPESPWQNRAERVIREWKRAVIRLLRRRQAPRCLWDFAGVYEAEKRSLHCHGTLRCQGRTPEEILTGNTPDISEYLDYGFYDWLWFYDSKDFPGERRILGRWLGVAHRVGQAMCYWVLMDNGTVVARSTVQPVTDDELRTDVFKAEADRFDRSIAERFKAGHGVSDKSDVPAWLFDEDDHLLEEAVEPIEPEAAMPEADTFDTDAFDEYISAEVILPCGNEQRMGKVLGRKRDADGNPIGKRDKNPLFDTREYMVEFGDGHVGEYGANLIAECLFSQVDDEGHTYQLLKEIIDHRKDESEAVKVEDAFVTSRNGNQVPRRTTKGWSLCVEWKDGSQSWVPLKDMKEAYPVQVAEYAVGNQIHTEPAFDWWVRTVLRRRDYIIAKVKTRYWKRTHKFGLEVPKTVERALQIDQETGTTFWRSALDKEMKNVPLSKFWMTTRWCRSVTSRFPVTWFSISRWISLVRHGWLQEATLRTHQTRSRIRVSFLVRACGWLSYWRRSTTWKSVRRTSAMLT